MKAKLELSFESIAELKDYIDRTTAALQTIPTPVITQMPQATPIMPPPALPVPEVTAGPQDGVAAARQEVAPTPPPTPAAPVSTAPVSEPVTPPPSAPTQEASSAAVSYSLDDLARAGADLLDQGKQAELPALLARFGITSLPDLPKERYGEFATAMREMGARI